MSDQTLFPVDDAQPAAVEVLPAQALYRRYRPHLWKQVVGQEHIVQTLRNAIRAGRVGHAYLFAGPRGTGKTTTARLLAKAVNCTEPDAGKRPCDQCENCKAVNKGHYLDLIEIDAASNTSVDDVRDLREKINFSPSLGQFKVYIIDEVHMLSTAAFNALLKTLEEPPPHAIFILATTEIHKIPATVLSRCQRHEFRRIPVTEIVGYLKPICKAEKIDVDVEVLTLIARQATGSMRDAISLLDQLASGGEKITLASAQTVLGTATSQVVVDLAQALLDRQPDAGLTLIHTALDSGSDPRQFARQVVDYLRGLLLIQMKNASQVEVTPELLQQMKTQAQRFYSAQLIEAVRLFNTAASETRGGWQPGLLLELAFAEAIEDQAVVPAQPAQPAVSRGVLYQESSTPIQPAPQPAPAQEEPAQKPVQSVAKPIPAAQPTPPAAEKPVQPAPTPTPPQPAAAAPEPKKPAVPAPAHTALQGGQVTLAQVQAQWSAIHARLKQVKAHSTEALLNSCKLQSLKDGVLVIGFASEIIKTKMEANDNIKVFRAAIQQVVGAELQIACVVMGNKVEVDPSDLSVDGDGIVGTALNLGGKIVKKEKGQHNPEPGSG